MLVNNAGITLDNLSIRLTEENWKKVIDINLTATFLLCKYSIKKMLKNKYGKIVMALFLTPIPDDVLAPPTVRLYVFPIPVKSSDISSNSILVV